MYRKAKAILTSIVIIGLMSACGQAVQVPPAHVGKILTKTGYKKQIISPSKFRLEKCFTYCDKLVVLEVSDKPKLEPFKLFMPIDQLNMSFDVRMTVAVNQEWYDDLFDSISPQGHLIPFDSIYNTYAQPVIRDVVRQVLANYSINDIASSRERISQELFNKVDAELMNTPIRLKRLGIADVQFPPVIAEAKENAAKRQEEIEQEKAELEKRKIVLEREFEEAKMRRQIEKEKAQGTKEVNEILAKSVTDKYLAYRGLEVLEKMASSDNKVFVPVEALGTVGLQHALFKSEALAKNKSKGK